MREWEEYQDFYSDLAWLFEAFFTVNLIEEKLPMILAYAKLNRIPEEDWPELLWGIKVIALALKKQGEGVVEDDDEEGTE